MPFPRSITSRVEGEALLRILRGVEGFEELVKGGASPRIEDVLRGATGVTQAELLHQCLGVEVDYRRQRGDDPGPEEYLQRFPDDEEVVRAVFFVPTLILPDLGSTVDIPPARGPGPLPATIGKFLVTGRLGTGGQASAFLARDPDIGHLVILKRYHASAGDGHVEGAIQDGQSLVRIRSRSIPRWYGIERVGGELVLVMEYVPGRNLAEVIKAGLPAPRAAAALIEQVAEGLEAVHACGLIHRDIKPANIVRGEDGVPRLVDFGLAAHLGSVALRGISGTPHYMAPEQARGDWQRIDVRTDIYGLGAVLYALLTGVPPHPGATAQEALDHAEWGEVKAPRECKRSIPREQKSIVVRALAADPGRRHATAAELRRALRDYRLGPDRRAATTLAGVMTLALVAGGLWLVLDTRKEPTPAVTTRPVPTALAGELTVWVWTPGGEGKQGWSVKDPAALPILAGEQVKLEARLNQPAYAYLLWIDEQGEVISMHPWSDFQFGPRPVPEAEREAVQCQEECDKGWPMRGPSGLETALRLVRRTPLPATIDMAALIGRMPPTALREPKEVVVRGFDEGQATETVALEVSRGIGAEAHRIDDPLLQLMKRLRRQGQFEVVKAVRFAYQGE